MEKTNEETFFLCYHHKAMMERINKESKLNEEKRDMNGMYCPDITHFANKEAMPIQPMNCIAKKKNEKENKWLYLCAFNYYSWKPIALGYDDGKGNAVFEKVVGRNFLMVARAGEKGELQYVTPPFYTEEGRKVRFLQADTTRTRRYTFLKKNPEAAYRLGYYRIDRRVVGNRVGVIGRDSIYKNSAAW